MATDYPPLDDHTSVEDFVGASCSLQSILSRNLNWPPDIGYRPIPYHLVNRNTLHIQQSATETACSDRLSALPHWHVPSHTQDQQPLPWLVVYPYHPIIETWGTSNTNSSYPTMFIPTNELDSDDNPALFTSLPESLREVWGNILISTRYRYILYHTNKKIRIKAAVFLTQRLNNNTPYFVNLRGRSASRPHRQSSLGSVRPSSLDVATCSLVDVVLSTSTTTPNGCHIMQPQSSPIVRTASNLPTQLLSNSYTFTGTLLGHHPARRSAGPHPSYGHHGTFSTTKYFLSVCLYAGHPPTGGFCL